MVAGVSPPRGFFLLGQKLIVFIVAKMLNSKVRILLFCPLEERRTLSILMKVKLL